jgi:O-Antigen ligase
VTDKLAGRTDKVFDWIPIGLLAVAAGSLAWNQYGSIYARDWLPYAVGIGLLVAGLFLSGVAERPATGAILTVAFLLGLAAWDALSLTWSPVPELARDEALLVAVYALAFLVPLLTLRREADRAAGAALVTGLVAVLAVAAFIHLLVVAHPTDDYENGRLTFPISYVNAQAAVLLVAFWPAISFAASRTLAPLLRSAALAGCSALLAGWLMTQSKGGLAALVVSGVAFFAFSPNRLRAVVPLLVSAALVGGSYELLTRPFRQRLSETFADAVRSAATTALLLTTAAAVIGLVYAFADRRVDVPPRATRVAGAALLGAVVVALAGSVAALFVVVDRPGHYLAVKWRHFKTLPGEETGSSHLASLGSNRYDFWRIELAAARDHPLGGIGARGFAQHYLAERRSTETPARGHSLELDVLSETGVVGLALLLAAIAVPLVLALLRAPSSPVAAGLAAAGVYGFAHASVDWVWTFPAFGVLVWAFLGIAVAGNGEERSLIRGWPSVACGVATVALAVGAFALPWVSSRLTSHALSHPASATDDLNWARRLDPLAVEPWLAQSSLSPSRAGSARALERAVEMQPRASGLRYLLGQAYLRAGQLGKAEAALARAHQLDPYDSDIVKALRRARAGR